MLQIFSILQQIQKLKKAMDSNRNEIEMKFLSDTTVNPEFKTLFDLTRLTSPLIAFHKLKYHIWNLLESRHTFTLNKVNYVRVRMYNGTATEIHFIDFHVGGITRSHLHAENFSNNCCSLHIVY